MYIYLNYYYHLISDLRDCMAGSGEGASAQQSPWLGLEASPKLEINSLICNKSLSVNSLDIEGGFLLCGTDSENIYTISMPHLS